MTLEQFLYEKHEAFLEKSEAFKQERRRLASENPNGFWNDKSFQEWELVWGTQILPKKNG